ncbi:unnamed protein product [Malus baccata var. baccata]
MQTEGEGGYLTTGKFDITVNQFSPVQLKKSEGEEDQRPEPVKCFVEGEIAHVESKNGISECGNPLETLSDSKVDKQEEDARRKGEALDIGEASVVVEEDSEGYSAVEHSKTSSTDHEGESETNLYGSIQPVTYELARPKLNSEEDEAATSRESSKTVTTAGDERQVVEQSFEEEGKVEEANTSYDTIEDETPDEQNLPVASILMRIVTESEIAEVGESTISEPNEIVETSEEVLNVSTVKGDEGDQGDGTNVTKDDKDVDTFSAKVAEDDEYTSAVTIKETSAKVTPNDDESSPQTLQKSDSGEELQRSRDVLPEETKTETSRENAEESTCTKEETTIQHTQESLDEAKKEATENTRNLEDDNAREEVIETSGTKQETGEHLVGEIHTESPQDFVDKETNEETSREYQAPVEAADLSTNTEEKNLEEQAIPELSSPVVVEETAKEIPKEEETGVLILKEEKKEEDAECNKPAEVASLTHETQSETTEDTTEPNKGLSAPISEESNKTFVENISTLAEVSETETEKNIQEKDGLAVSYSDSASGEVSHVTGLKKAETEKEEQKENIDTAPEEKGQATIFKDEMASEVEDIGVQAEENCESKEKLEEHIPTAADEGEAFSKEAEAEIEEQINNSDVAAEEKVSETILTNEKSFDVEDTNVQAEKNVESNENLEENIPTAADEGETFPKEAEAESKDEIKNADIAHADIDGHGDEIDRSEENLDKQIPAGECETSSKAAEAEYKEQVIHADIAPEEKGLATILTDETPLDIEDIEVKTEDCVESKENVEEQITTTADEGEKSTYISPEGIEVQVDENFITLENLEKPIRTTSGERETGLGEAEAEIKEQVKSIDIVPEEMATISTTETPLDVEDIGVQAEETLKSKENVEEHIPTAADEGEKFLKEAEAENKEQIDEETLNSQESSDKEKEEVTEITNTKDDTEREEVLETTSTEQETGEHVVHEIHTVLEPPPDSIDKETNEDNSAEYQACTEVADVSTSAEEKNLEEHAIRELSSPLVVEEATKEIPEVERQDKNIDTAPEEKGQATISADDMASEVEDIDVQLKENLESEENLEEQFPIAADEGEIISKEAKAENQEQIKNVDIAHEDVDAQAVKTVNAEENIDKQIPPIAHEGETSLKETAVLILKEEKKEEDTGESNNTFVENISTLAEVSETETEKNVQEKNGLAVSNSDSASGEVSRVTGLKEAETEKEEKKENIDTAPEDKGEATIVKDEMASEVEDIDLQAEENCESKEKLEEHSPTAADKVEIFSKEAEAENEEQKNNSDVAAEEKVSETILTNERTFDVENTNVQAEKNVESNENLEETIPTAADEGETCLQEAEAEGKDEIKSTDIAHTDTDGHGDEIDNSEENLDKQIPAGEREISLKAAEAEYKEQVKHADIVPEEKGPATVLTDETPLDVEDIEVKTEDCVESKENVEEQIPTTVNEGGKSTYISPEDIEVQADGNFITLENLEKPILTTSGERETGLGEAEAEIKEQVKSIDIVPEEMATISTAETPSDVEVIGVQAEESLKSKENMEEQIPTAADEDERFLKESKAENKELIDEENLNSQEQVTEITNTIEDDTEREEVLETTSTEQETGEHIVHEIHTVPEPPRDSIDKETNEDNSAEYQACTEAADLSTSAEEKNLEEHAIRELSSPLVVEEATKEIPKEEETYATLLEEEEMEGHATCNKPNEEDEAEIEKNIQEKDGNTVGNSESLSGELSHVTALKECETEIEGQDKNIDTAPEEKGQATISADETASEVEDIDVQLKENLKSEENLEEQFPTAADEGEIISKEAEAKNQEQIKHVEIAHEDVDAQAEKTVNSEENIDKQILPIAHEGETSLKETAVLILKEEKKEEDAECNEPAEVASMTHETRSETTEDITEPNKDLNAPISEESNKTFVENISTLAEVSETETEKNVQEKNGLAVSNSDSASGEVSHVTGLKEAETEKEEQKENIDTAPEEKVQATVLKDEMASEVEDIGVHGEENCESKEKLEEHIPTAADKVQTLPKEAEAENEEQINNSDVAAEEKVSETILTNERTFDVEDTNVQAEKNVESNENLEETIPTAADEGETSLQEAEAESKDEIKSADIVPEEKGLATVLTDETPLDVEDIEVKTEDCVESKENVEEQIPTTADEGEKSTYISPEDIEVQADEFITLENLEKPIRTSGERETGLGEAEAEIKEQVKSIDIVPEEMATISTAETPSDVEVIGVQAEESLKSKENVEEHIPTAADEGGKFLKEAEAENKEQIDEENLNSQESSDKGKQEVTETRNTLEDDTAREEVLETTSTEQETGEHGVHEIHTVVEPPQDSIDKETNEENSAGYQACTDADDLSTTAEEKNLEEHDIQELSSPLVVEEETNEIPKEEETYATLLEEEKKEGHATCNEPTEKYEAEIEKNIQEKDGNTVSNSESLSGELSHVTALRESEIEIERQDKNIDTAAEEKGQVTILKGETASEVEDIGVQAKEKYESKENLEHIPTAADEVETFLKEGEAENEEQINNSDVAAEEKVLETILTNEKSFNVEDTNVQAEKNVESNENLEENIPTAADEGETFPKEAEAESKDEIKDADIPHADIDGHGDEIDSSEENLDKQIPAGECETSLKAAEAEYKEQVIHADFVPEEKGLATILTDETPLDVKDIEVKTEDCAESKENVEEQIPTTAEEGEKNTYISHEDVEVQADENFITLENLENPISTTSGERETGLGEAEAEIKEQVKSIDIVPDEIATISTSETPLDVEDIGLQAEENLISKENVEEQIPTAADEGEEFLKEAEAENKEQIDEETSNSQESSDKEKEMTEITSTKDGTEREEVLETTSTEQETGEHVVHEIHTVPEPPRDSIDKETNEDNSAEYQVCTEAADLSTSAEEKNLEEHAIRELSSPLVVEEATTKIPKEEETYTTLLEEEEKEGHATCNEPNEEYETEIEKNIQEKDGNTVNNSESLSGELSHVTALKESETEIERQDKNIDTAPEEKGQATISADEMASEVEDIDVQLKENHESEDNLEEQFPIAAVEGEIILKEAEAENKEQIKNVNIAHEDVDAQAEKTVISEENIDKQIPTIAHEGETSLKEAEAEDKEQVTYADIAPEEKGLATILTDETPLEAEDIGVKAEESFESKEKSEEKNPVAADDDETFSKEAEAENKEQIKYSDIAPEDKGLATILTDEKALNIEDIGLQEEETFNSSENLESKIPSTADEHETTLEHIYNTDISPEEKGLATISTDEATLDVEDIGVQAERSCESKEDFEEKIPTEDETFLKEAQAETKEHIKCSDITPEEKGISNILTDETSLDIKDIEVKADESFESNENLEKQIPIADGEGETRLREAEAESDEQVKNDIAPEEKVLETITKDEMTLDIDDACVQLQAEENSDTKEFLDEQNPTVADEGEEKIAHGNVVLNDTPGVQILEESEPKVGVEEESCKSEAQPEKTSTIVEEVFDQSKITGRDFNKEEIVEGNVACFTQESIEEDTVNKSQEIEIEKKNLKEEGSCIESLKEGNGDDLSLEHIPEDESETFKDDKKDVVKSGGEILKVSQADGVDESITCETTMIAERSEEIVTSPLTYEECKKGESSSPVSKEEGSNEDTFSTKVAEEGDGDNGAVTVIETSEDVNGEEGLPQAGQKYEPVEGHEKLLDQMPEESKTESSSENAEVVTCTKEEIKIQNIQESSDEEKKEETTPVNGTKENETEVKEVFQIASTEQETGEHATREIHTVEDNTQEFNDKETTEENLNEYQVSSEAADSSTDIVGKNSEEQASRELSSSLVGEDTTIESSKQEENYVLSLKEEENEANVECKEPVEVANTAHETKFETLEDSIEPKEDMYAPTSEEETHTDLKGAEAETKEQVKDIEIDHEEKGLATILTDGAALENPTLSLGNYCLPVSNINLFFVQILKEPEIAGAGESTTYETNQIAETSEEIFDASPVKYEEGQPGEGSSQDSAKASKEEDVTEDDDNNDAVTVTESNAEVTSKGEEDSAQPSEKYEPEEEKVPVKISDVADAKEVCDVEDKASLVEKTTEETSLQKEVHAEVSEVAPEKLDVEATEEGFKEGSEIVHESDSRSIDVVSKDEIATSQTLEEVISQEQVEIPSSTLLTEAKEIEASQHEHETPTKDKNIEEEHEQEMPADENARDLSAVRSEDETPLPKEESEELKPSALALEKLDAGDTEEEIKETLKTISKSDSQSTDAVPKDEIVADQTHLEASYASLPKEEELKTYQDDRETTTQDKGVEEEYAKETEVPADESGRDLVAPTLAEETLLQKEEPEELNVSDLAPQNLDAGEMEEIKESFEKVSKSDSQSSEVVSGDETTAYQTLHEVISNEQLQLPSSTLVPEEKEIKISQREHETTTQDKNKEDGSTEKNEVPADENTRDLFVAATSEEETCLQKEEAREFNACELAPEKLDAGETEEIKETLETISESDSQGIETVSKDAIVADQTLVGASYTSLPKEKEHEAGENETTAYRALHEGESNTELAGVKATEESFHVQSLEEVEPKLTVEDESRESEDHPENNMIVEQPQLLEHVLDEPKSTDGDFGEGQTTEGNAALCTPDIILEESPKNSQNIEKETENLQEEILEEPEIAGVGKSTTYETNQIAETSEEIFDASPVKYGEGHPGEGSSQDSAKASKEEDVTEDDDNNGAVTVTESSAEVTSKGEEDLAHALEKYEPEEEKVPVKISDVADAKEVCYLEDKASFAKKTTEETSLQTEGHAEVSELAPEKLAVNATEEECKEGSEIVPESDSRSIDVVSKDEIVTSLTLDEGISQDQVKIPSSTLLAEAKETEGSQHEHETPTKDKNIEEEHEKEVPADENAGDLSAVGSEDETPLQKEESEELKSSKLALEKLDAGDTEEEIKETFKTISKSDSQSTDAVPKDEIVADQTHLEASYASLPKEEELKTYQDDCETATQDKSIEEVYAKEIEVPADENDRDLVAAALAEETLLQKDEPGELKVPVLAPENLDACQTEEMKNTLETVSEPDYQSTAVVTSDEAISDQTLHEGISTEKLQIPSSALLPEEKEIKASEEHGTTFSDKNIEENASNLQMQDDENTKATSTAKETSLTKEEPRELKASDFELHLTQEVPRESSNEEITEDEKLPEESELDSVREESHHENKAEAEKQGEQTDETSTIRTNEHQHELSEVDEKGIPSEKYERQLTFEDLTIKEHDPRFIEDKTIQDGFPEEEKRVEEAAFEFGLKNQDDERNSKSSITETQMEKDSKKSPIAETSQEVEAKDTKSTNETCVAPEIKERIQMGTHSPEEKEATTTSKEQQIEEDEEEEHENSEEVKTDEEKGENEHKNGEPGYDSPIMVEASRDADVNVKVVSHKKSNNILSGIKHSISKVKKAITGKSSHSKTKSEK